MTGCQAVTWAWTKEKTEFFFLIMKVVHTHFNLEKIKKHREGKELYLESHPLEAVTAHVACPLCPLCCGRMFGPNVMSRRRACISFKQQHFIPWGRWWAAGVWQPRSF